MAIEELPEELAGLTDRQARFVLAYTGEHFGNATWSAHAAGHRGTNGSLRVRGAEYRANRAVQAAIRARLARLGMADEEILARWADQAQADMEDCLNVGEDGGLTFDFTRAQRTGQLRRLRSIQIYERYHAGDGPRGERLAERRVRFEFLDVQEAQRLLAQVSGLLSTERRESEERPSLVEGGPGDGVEGDDGAPAG